MSGKRTAGFAARRVKDNEQVDSTDKRLSAVRELVAKQIMGHPVFQMAARPKQLNPLLFSRYEVGMQYGSHVDDALMQANVVTTSAFDPRRHFAQAVTGARASRPLWIDLLKGQAEQKNPAFCDGRHIHESGDGSVFL